MNWGLIWQGFLETCMMTVMASSISYLLGLPLGVLLVITRKDGIKPAPTFNAVLGTVINFLRSIPFIILLVMLLNGLTFGALGVLAAIVASTHADIARFSTFAILPMTFLCNTFFPLERVPGWIRVLISILPLTHASGSLRAIAYGGSAGWLSLVILAAYAVVFMLAANVVVVRRENL